jgi:hypothetical protein
MEHTSPLSANVDPLTARELQTLRLIAQGLSSRKLPQVYVHEHDRQVCALFFTNPYNRTQAALYAVKRPDG